jgi:hypothetical protein
MACNQDSHGKDSYKTRASQAERSAAPPGIHPSRVTLQDPDHLRYWAARLGCTPARLQAAVKIAGTIPAGVKQYLQRGR